VRERPDSSYAELLLGRLCPTNLIRKGSCEVPSCREGLGRPFWLLDWRVASSQGGKFFRLLWSSGVLLAVLRLYLAILRYQRASPLLSYPSALPSLCLQRQGQNRVFPVASALCRSRYLELGLISDTLGHHTAGLIHFFPHSLGWLDIERCGEPSFCRK